MTDSNADTNDELNGINIVPSRSEILFMLGCKDTNPNGNPQSTSNRPRIDPITNQVVITDVRLKRYARDQLDEDGHGVYIRNASDDEGFSKTREALIKDCVSATDPEEVGPDMLNELLDGASDIRMFGATLSLNTDDDDLVEELAEVLPSEFTGPIQFSPGRSIHPVVENEESKSLTSVIATGEGKEQGGYDLDDHRIKYALVPFHGVVNENSAQNTRLTESDVKRLDTLLWRSIKNQTNTRSKKGQEPRLYLRVEYNEDSFQIGLDSLIDMGETSKPAEELRNITDAAIDMSNVVGQLDQHADHIDTVHVRASDLLDIEIDGEDGNAEFLYDALRDAVGTDSVHVVDVYDEYEATLPDSDD